MSSARMEVMLWNAAQAGDTEALAAYLDAGLDPNSSTETGITPLMFAAIEGREAAVRLLLLRGAHVSVRDSENRTALTDARQGYHSAPAARRLEFKNVIQLLKDAGTDD